MSSGRSQFILYRGTVEEELLAPVAHLHGLIFYMHSLHLLVGP
jgi:hypothetical protein